jgi:hypothetical protein
VEKHRRLQSCHSCNIEDPVEIESPPMKKRKIDSQLDVGVCMDPIKRLPEHFINDVLCCLNNDELLSAMTVSKEWNDFIKVRSVFTNKVVFNPSVKSCPLPLMLQIFSEENSPRSYKHMVTPFNLCRPFFSVINPIEFYASTLETLVLKDVEEGSDLRSCEDGYEVTNKDVDNWMPKRVNLLSNSCSFPKLRKLTQSLIIPLDNLKGSTFPVLTHLQLIFEKPIQYIRDDDGIHIDACIDIKEIRKFLRLFPKLEVFMISLETMGMKWEESDEEEDTMISNRVQPKIKAIYLPKFIPEITDEFKETLEKLEIHSMNFRNPRPQTINILDEFLQDFKALKSLSIFAICISKEDELKQYVSNESIEILKIFCISQLHFVLHANVQQCLKNLLLALPSLKELVLYHAGVYVQPVTADMLKFLGKRPFKKKI